jgi:hypothetical protein
MYTSVSTLDHFNYLLHVHLCFSDCRHSCEGGLNYWMNIKYNYASQCLSINFQVNFSYYSPLIFLSRVYYSVTSVQQRRIFSTNKGNKWKPMIYFVGLYRVFSLIRHPNFTVRMRSICHTQLVTNQIFNFLECQYRSNWLTLTTKQTGSCLFFFSCNNSIGCGVLIKQNISFFWKQLFFLEHYFLIKYFLLCQEAFRNEAVPTNTTVHPVMRKLPESGSVCNRKHKCGPTVLSNDVLELEHMNQVSALIATVGILLSWCYKVRLHFKINTLWIQMCCCKTFHTFKTSEISFLWIPGRESYHTPPSSTEVECMELYLHFPNKSSWCGA